MILVSWEMELTSNSKMPVGWVNLPVASLRSARNLLIVQIALGRPRRGRKGDSKELARVILGIDNHLAGGEIPL